jgi:hypothetical protein
MLVGGQWISENPLPLCGGLVHYGNDLTQLLCFAAIPRLFPSYCTHFQISREGAWLSLAIGCLPDHSMKAPRCRPIEHLLFQKDAFSGVFFIIMQQHQNDASPSEFGIIVD